MYYLGYISAESMPFNEIIITDILNKSRNNNPQLGITGILLHVEGCLLQLLEGDRENVEKLYNKISQDSRHTAIVRLIEGEQERRCFEDWSMGFKSLTIEESIALNNYLDLRTGKWKSIESRFEDRLNPILIFLKSFYLGDIGVGEGT
ncbi:MAG TPA: BLUF domain-containing protein [Cytophagaceae bacterium]|jgi:hypothetical protein